MLTLFIVNFYYNKSTVCLVFIRNSFITSILFYAIIKFIQYNSTAIHHFYYDSNTTVYTMHHVYINYNILFNYPVMPFARHTLINTMLILYNHSISISCFGFNIIMLCLISFILTSVLALHKLTKSTLLVSIILY